MRNLSAAELLANAKRKVVVGNAYSDRSLIDLLWEIAVDALTVNDLDTGYEALDFLATHVMGCPPMPWEEFVESVIMEDSL